MSYTTNSNEVISGNVTLSTPLKGDIEFRNISFSYTEGTEVLKDFNLRVKSGSILGIVGKNGSGKTTIGRLLTRVCSPTSGKILIDGINITEYDFDYYQNQIECVTQENFILPEELENMNCDMKFKEEFTEFTQRLNFIERRLDRAANIFRLKENSLNISGGELQKVSLFKAYKSNKPICILDEPTSAIDTCSEDKVIEFIDEKFKGRTLIIITHKPQILKICDKVIDLEKNIKMM